MPSDISSYNPRSKVPGQFAVSQRDKKEKAKQKTRFDSRHRVTDLKPLSPGDIMFGCQTKEVLVMQVIGEDTPHSYNVETSTGVYRRNRRHIIPLPATEPSVEDNTNTQSNDVSSVPETTLPTTDTNVVKTRSGWSVKPSDRLAWTLRLCAKGDVYSMTELIDNK